MPYEEEDTFLLSCQEDVQYHPEMVCVRVFACIYVCERDMVFVWLGVCVFMRVREIWCVCGCVCVYLCV
jgi:hypothetical protein